VFEAHILKCSTATGACKYMCGVCKVICDGACTHGSITIALD